jgi:hypothetical protein
MMGEPYRVAVWGPGIVGSACLRQLLDSPAYKVVAVHGYNPDKDGKDVGELLGLPSAGVAITTDPEAILQSDAQVVLHSPRFAVDMTDSDSDVVKLLTAGKNVISATGYQYPFRYGHDYVQMLYDACKSGGASLMGTGVHPGFMGEMLAATLSGLNSRMEKLTIREYVELSHTRNADGLTFIGYGRDPAELDPNGNPVFGALERYWGDTLSYLARLMYNADARIERITRFIPAREDIEIPVMTIRKGHTAAINHVLRAYVDGVVRFEIDEYLYHTDKAKPREDVDCSDYYELELEGKPSSALMRMSLRASIAQDLDFWPGDPTPQAWYATATPMVHAIPLVIRAEPGLVLPEVSRHFISDPRRAMTMPEFVRAEMDRVGVTL